MHGSDSDSEHGSKEPKFLRYRTAAMEMSTVVGSIWMRMRAMLRARATQIEPGFAEARWRNHDVS